MRWTQSERRRERHVCFGVMPAAADTVIGIIQAWPIEPDFSVAEWGFALGRRYWHTGLFADAADRFLRFAFNELGVRRLEARVAAPNAGGHRMLESLGGAREGVLRSAFRKEDATLDQVMWSILAVEWLTAREEGGASPE